MQLRLVSWILLWKKPTGRGQLCEKVKAAPDSVSLAQRCSVGARQLKAVGAVFPAILLLVATDALAQDALVKRGSCPSGYHTSGGYCIPSSKSSRAAIAKVGSCPSGYHTSGDYCLASSDNAKHAVIKAGSCPSGYHTSGDYCLRN